MIEPEHHVKNSIRRKILMPFLFIIAAMAMISSILSIYVFSESLSDASEGKMIVAVIVSFVLASLLLFFVYSIIIRKITSSIDVLYVVTQKVAQGDLNQRIHLTSDDEIGRLSQVFNHMIESLKESSGNLLTEKNRSEAILSCMPNGVIVTDLDNRLILANRHAEDIFTISSNKIQGEDLMEHIYQQDIIDILKEKISQEHNVIVREAKLRNKKGQDRIYKLTSTVATTELGDPIGMITVLQDITHDKEIEELREGFLRTVSHELRTPLTSIVGFIELLHQGKGGDITDTQKECLEVVLNEANSLKVLIEDLLDLSRIRAGKTRLAYTHVNIQELFESLCQSFQPLAKGKGLSLIADEVATQLSVQADVAHLRRILINLISNAIKFTNEGEVRVTCRDEDDAVLFSVHDTGIGLLDEEKSVIFERFRQVDYSQTRKYEGIGLGLSIVKQLVEMHRGQIMVESEYGKGSTFSFRIPKIPFSKAPRVDS